MASLDSLNRAELDTLAARHDIDPSGLETKAQLIAALNAAGVTDDSILSAVPTTDPANPILSSEPSPSRASYDSPSDAFPSVGFPGGADRDAFGTDRDAFGAVPGDRGTDRDAFGTDRDAFGAVPGDRGAEDDLARNMDGSPVLAFTTFDAAVAQAERLGGGEDDVYREGVAFGVKTPPELANLTAAEWLARYPRRDP